MTEPVLRVEELNVWFQLRSGVTVHAVRGASFELFGGARLGLVGESGCGKTTTILALMGLLPPTATVSGRILLDGENILAGGERTIAPHRWRDLAMVFQGAMNALNPVKRVCDQIAEPMLLHRTSDRRRHARAHAQELLEMVGISPRRARCYPHEFSGGMRQRAALAMALACGPKILLADEPTTALDVMVQAQILELLVQLSDRLGLTVVMVTHDLPVVAEVCDRTAVMYAGEIVELGATGALFEDPRHPYTRMLFNATPDLDSDAPVRAIPGAPPRLDRSFRGCPFAPRCDVATPACTVDPPPVVQIEDGHRARCHVNLPAAREASP